MTFSGSPLARQWDRAAVDAVLDLSPDPVWLVDRDDTMAAFNRPFAGWWTSISGQAPRIGSPLHGSTPVLRDAQRRVLAGRSMVVDVRLIAGGVERPYAIHGRPVESIGAVDAAAFLARELTDAEAGGGGGAVELALMHLF